MPDAGEVAVTQDERTMAALAHVLQLVAWWLAPLIIFLLRRQSRFVSFHALQALLFQIALVVFWVVVAAAWFAMFLVTVIGASAQGGPPTGIFVLFPLFWIFAMAAWVLMLVAAIVYGIRAGRGEWAEYPVLGRLARRMLKI